MLTFMVLIWGIMVYVCLKVFRFILEQTYIRGGNNENYHTDFDYIHGPAKVRRITGRCKDEA